jgi:hypothetical protein
MKCICGGILDFCKAFKNNKVPKDIYEFKCPCGIYLYIRNGVLWTNYYPIDLDKIK